MKQRDDHFRPGLVVVGRADPAQVALHLCADAQAAKAIVAILPERQKGLFAYTQMEKLCHDAK